uniref:Uncharacterized protein n=2 Tax=Oryza TaxID=4527 RepID=Q2QWL0_ORYSJ|nr:hypothetical protein LOC_Os12g08990 [Oryza sativa Japonica Group]
MHPTSRSLLPFFLAESPVARTVAVEGEAAMGKGLGEVATPSASSVRARKLHAKAEDRAIDQVQWQKGRGEKIANAAT